MSHALADAQWDMHQAHVQTSSAYSLLSDTLCLQPEGRDMLLACMLASRPPNIPDAGRWGMNGVCMPKGVPACPEAAAASCLLHGQACRQAQTCVRGQLRAQELPTLPLADGLQATGVHKVISSLKFGC